MKRELKLIAAVVVAATMVMATVVGAFANAPALRRAFGELKAVDSRPASMAAKCGSKMTVSDVAWVTLDEDFEIEEQVDAYPSGTTMITPVFQYNCVPKKITLVTVFTFDGEEVFSDKETLKATKNEGLYGYPLTYEGDAPFPDGEWGVQFYNNKTLLIEGAVVVGDEGGGEQGEAVTVQGVVTYKKSGKPIKGATILVLEPGVTVQDWLDGGQEESEVYTAGQTDSRGQFVLEAQMEREVEYSVIVVAKGYKPIGQDGFMIAEEDTDPLELDIQMTK